MTLQHNVKVQPELYIDDTVKAVGVFKEEYNKVKNNPAPKNERFNHYLSFLAHVSDIFKHDLSFIPQFLYELLLNYGTILNPAIRLKCVQSIMLMRNKDIIAPIEALNIFFKLLTIKDKEMRKIIISHIINDIKRMNSHRKNMPVNKQVQNFIYDIIKNNSDTLAKRAMFIIISLYRKQVWNDAKTVNVIASGCFSENDKVVNLACNFLIQTTEETHDSDSESDGEEDTTNKKSLGKKTKNKEQRKERELKRIKRRERRKSKIQLMKNFFPIDMINNPQDFCDRLFNHMKKKNHKFEVKLSIMAVLGRMIGRHKLLVMNFYPYMIKYIMPHQKEVSKILAYVAESAHELVPPDDLQVVLKHLTENFVSERCGEEKMTVGLNTIQQMCERAPLMMDEFFLNHLGDYKTYKEKNVATAARALINYYRDINPELLDKRHRGRFDMLERKDDRKVYMYGETKIHERVDGADLLKTFNGVPAECDRILTDEDFKKIKVLKRRKMEEDAEKRESLNQFTRAQKNNQNNNEEEEEDDDEELDDEELEELEDGDDEEGEELEFEDGEDGSEIVEEEGEGDGEEWEDVDPKDKAPKGKKKKGEVKKKAIDEDDVNLEEEGDLEDSDDENPNNFVSEGAIARFKMRKSQRKAKEREEAKVKEKRQWTPKYQLNRKGNVQKGVKNDEKQKNKALMMLRPKKNREKEQLAYMKNKIKQMKRQIGHVRNPKEARSKRIKGTKRHRGV